MLETLTREYIMTMVIVALVVVAGIILYYLGYNRTINKRITTMQKGKHLVSPLRLTEILVVMGLLISGVCTYRYDKAYNKAYAQMVYNSKGIFDMNKIDAINAQHQYDVYHKETKYEKITYYVLKSHQFTLNSYRPKVYITFTPKDDYSYSYMTYQVREFKERQYIFFTNSYKEDQHMSFSTRLTGTTVHLEIERTLWRKGVMERHVTKDKDGESLSMKDAYFKEAAGKEMITLAVAV